QLLPPAAMVQAAFVSVSRTTLPVPEPTKAVSPCLKTSSSRSTPSGLVELDICPTHLHNRLFAPRPSSDTTWLIAAAKLAGVNPATGRT
ncbi:hypothetical protein ACDY96_10575, partial [Rhizobium mongolense]|uniref:hypothetical protein n=1 Tax=Rhizobium mongolense TaxID=57676 RepID=UPI003559242B